jgi:hypothetical protein
VNSARGSGQHVALGALDPIAKLIVVDREKDERFRLRPERLAIKASLSLP